MIFIDDEQLSVKFKIKTIVSLPLFYTTVVFLENSTYIKIELVRIYKKEAHEREGFFPYQSTKRDV